MEQTKFFNDLLVVELASVLAGPAVGMFFAELGARVIKIENKKTEGDVTRKWKLSQENPNDKYSSYYHSINWGKESMLLDLQNNDHREQVYDLIKKADVVISNFKKDSADKLKMDYNSLRMLNPNLIYGGISAYGNDNPAPGFDAMLQAETGWISMNGEKGGQPVKLPVALVDILAAHQLKQGLLLALMNRQQSGKGSQVNVSLYDASIAALANQASNWLNASVVAKPMGSQHPNIAPYGDIFYTKDKVAVLLGTGTQKQFESLCAVLTLKGIEKDERFKTNASRLEHRAALNELIGESFENWTFDKLRETCQKQAVTIARINALDEVFQNQAAKNLVLDQELPDGRKVKCVKTVVFKIGY